MIWIRKLYFRFARKYIIFPLFNLEVLLHDTSILKIFINSSHNYIKVTKRKIEFPFLIKHWNETGECNIKIGRLVVDEFYFSFLTFFISVNTKILFERVSVKTQWNNIESTKIDQNCLNEISKLNYNDFKVCIDFVISPRWNENQTYLKNWNWNYK